MVKNPKMLRNFEDSLLKSSPINIEQNFLIANSLLSQARALGTIPGNNPLEGLDLEIKAIKYLNGIRKSSS